MTGNSKDIIEISVTSRKLGKGPARKARQDKMIPAMIYGPKTENQPVLIDELTVTRYGRSRYESTIFALKSDDKKLNSKRVLFKDIQKDPATNRPVHVDLLAPDMTASIRVNIEIKLTGTPEGVKTEGGQLMQSLRDLEVECLASEIPDALTVDVSALNLHESIHVSDLQLPDGVEAITPGERAVATVTSVREEPAADETAAAAEGEAAEGAAAAAPEGDKKESSDA